MLLWAVADEDAPELLLAVLLILLDSPLDTLLWDTP